MGVRSLLPSIHTVDTSLSEPCLPLSPLPFFRLRYCCLDSTCHFSRELLPGPRRHIREERAESLYHRRVRENGIAQPRVLLPAEVLYGQAEFESRRLWGQLSLQGTRDTPLFGNSSRSKNLTTERTEIGFG
jgi:hypothetical protein